MTTYALSKRQALRPSLPAWIDYALFWIPNARKPGLLAFGLYLARVTVLPMALAFAVLAPFASALPRHPLAGLTVMLAFAVLTEECGRYGFVRRAESPIRALTLFTLLVIIVETTVYWRGHASILVNLALRAPSMLVHVLAGAALLWAMRRPARILPTMLAVYALHLCFDVGSVAVFGDRFAHSPTLGAQVAASEGRKAAERPQQPARRIYGATKA